MDKLYKRFDRFCARHSRLGVPNLMIYVSAGIALVYLFSLIDPSGAIYYFFSFNRALILKGQIWRLLTYIFIPNVLSINQILLLAIELYFFVFIGRILENEWGIFRFNVFYFTGVLITAVAAILLHTTASALYISLSMLLAYATLYPDNQVLLFFIIPLKMKYLAYGYLAFTAVGIIFGSFPSNMLPIFALLNYALFFYPDIKSFITRSRTKYSKQNTHFRREMRNVRRENTKAGPDWASSAKVYSSGGTSYRHKCYICGKTDADYPEMDFRYCSRCNGYYCYCPEHIHNHIHVE